jgi:hypothetical protein
MHFPREVGCGSVNLRADENDKILRYWLTASIYANGGLAGIKHSRQPMVLDCATQRQQNMRLSHTKELQPFDSRNNDLIIIARRKEFAPLLDKLQPVSDS